MHLLSCPPQEDAVQEAPRPGLFAFRGTVRAPGGSGALGGGSLIRVLPGGGGMVVLTVDPNDELARINMRLRQLDEELGYSGARQGAWGACLQCGDAVRRGWSRMVWHAFGSVTAMWKPLQL